MNTKMKASEFVSRLRLALESKTQYALGGFGAPAGAFNNKTRYMAKDPKRAALIKAASADTFLFDCVCMGKGILWGWKGDVNARYGGANYLANDVPDFVSSNVKNHCVEWSDDMDPAKIAPGEWLLFNDGSHIGYYVGDGKVIESTAAGKCKVQMSTLTQREWGGRWIGHGKLKYIEYDTEAGKKDVPEIVCPCCGARFVKE